LHINIPLLHITIYLLHITVFLLHITISLLHITVSLLHITVSLLHITIYLLHIAIFLLHITVSLLHINISLLHITIYLLHITIPLLHIAISLLYITLLWTISFNLITLIKRTKMWISLLCISFHPPLIFCLLAPDIFLITTSLLSCEKWRMFWQVRLQYSSKLILLALSHNYLTAKAYDTRFFNIKQWLSLYIRKSIKNTRYNSS
jgi:hypothetical protein